MQSWLKLWIESNLDGSVRVELTPAERGTYYDLQLLAKKCDQGGFIRTESGKPYPKKWIAARLNITPKLVLKTIQKGVKLGLIKDSDNGIFLVKFMESQSDYYRQKPYRRGVGRKEDPDKFIKGQYGQLVRR